MKGLFVFLSVLLLLLIAAPVYAGGCDCDGKTCTLSVPVVAEIRHVTTERTKTVVAAAGRSVGRVGKAVVAPVRVVEAIAEKKLVRNAIAAKPARKALAVVGRCICHRRHSE